MGKIMKFFNDHAEAIVTIGAFAAFTGLLVYGYVKCDEALTAENEELEALKKIEWVPTVWSRIDAYGDECNTFVTTTKDEATQLLQDAVDGNVNVDDVVQKDAYHYIAFLSR